jgi:hypothetical protein
LLFPEEFDPDDAPVSYLHDESSEEGEEAFHHGSALFNLPSFSAQTSESQQSGELPIGFVPVSRARTEVMEALRSQFGALEEADSSGELQMPKATSRDFSSRGRKFKSSTRGGRFSRKTLRKNTSDRENAKPKPSARGGNPRNSAAPAIPKSTCKKRGRSSTTGIVAAPLTNPYAKKSRCSAPSTSHASSAIDLSTYPNLYNDIPDHIDDGGYKWEGIGRKTL